ncbi:MAG: hypothetical protein AB1488_02420 [Nitrospirota bacterium]
MNGGLKMLWNIVLYRQLWDDNIESDFTPLENALWLATGLFLILRTRGLMPRVSFLTGFTDLKKRRLDHSVRIEGREYFK